MVFAQFFRCVSAALLTCVFCFSAKAVPITYTEMTTATGALDGVAFQDTLVTITMIGNTSAATMCIGVNNCTTYAGSATVTVSGVGTDKFKDTIEAVANQNNKSVRFTDANVPLPGFPGSRAAILVTTSSVFATYVISDAIGPITGEGEVNSGLEFPTSNGDFVLNFINPSGTLPPVLSTYTATISQTPIPAALPLFATALGGLGLLGRRRKRKAVTA